MLRPVQLATTTLLLAALSLGVEAAHAQHEPMPPVAQQAQRPPVRTRLYLKDGSYQLVLSYKVSGKLIRYVSAERNAETEEIPLDLVDLPRTRQWQRDHDPDQPHSAESAGPVLSPELARAEAARAARTPTVAPHLKLPTDISVLVLDTFRGTPELVPLAQQGSDLNPETAHAVQRGAINPSSGPHRILDLKGQASDVQLHVDTPTFFVRLGKNDEEESDIGGTFVVHTDGTSDREVPSGGADSSGYVLERVEPRQDLRIVDSFRIAWLETGRPQPDIIELKAEPLPGGRWLKLTPTRPLEFGEYALIEVLDTRTVNLNVWDFGVHSDAKENTEAIPPESPRSTTLTPR